MKFFGLLSVCLAMAGAVNSTTNKSTFAGELFHTIAKEKTSENIIFSPISIRSCLALVYLGAEGDTAVELKNALQLSGGNKQLVSEEFGKLLAKTRTDEAKVKIANRVYVDKKYEVSAQFNEIASKSFDSAVERVEFKDSSVAADKINTWVEKKTENNINNLIDASSLDEGTAALLVNAIYFRANWTNYFGDIETEQKDFSVSSTKKVPVDMMHQKDKFLYSELKDLDATAVELPYENTDIVMLVILPKSVEGLSGLEEKLKNVDLTKLSDQFKMEKVNLNLPKFKVEFGTSLQPVLEKLGMTTMFTNAADFSSLLATDQKLRISEVKHKAFIEVNEVGTVAAAATYVKAFPLSLVLNEVVYDFVANHPFFFAIKDKENVYFAGHVAKF